MPARVEKDTVVTVPAIEPGSERRLTFELRVGDRPGSVQVHSTGHYGTEVSFSDLYDALAKAEREFAPSLRSA